ncbi:FHA domain-containing protein At4g14490-like [Abrus precatorius]|uniref:FHA domain-containing protein At4g14490-like n=1 Tax=Abrus precatorius TaxID=3816 RepID=A0A8B8L127_ABRPR|nr:FHA domain-containing protein At4g14490-like [Abrus precatorius]
MEEEAPTLRLVMLQGPREGETLDFPPGTSIRIGRVVRGNSFAIKDPGISSKHFSIVNESNKWLLQDLDSSNGTVFEGSKIPPHTPFPLHHDSTIKIGELTSIHVIFLPSQQQHTTATHVRRNPTRGARTGEPVQPVAKRGRPAGKGSKARVQIQTIDKNASVANESSYAAPPARVTRNSRKKPVSDSSVLNLEEEAKSTLNPTLIEISDLDAPVEEPKNSKEAIGDSTENSRIECGVKNFEKKETRDDSEIKEREKENLNGNWPDLKKMSLGEWFDFLEVHFPKQIMDATEEMIESMNQKAQRLRDYIILTQQQNDKVKLAVKE